MAGARGILDALLGPIRRGPDPQEVAHWLRLAPADAARLLDLLEREQRGLPDRDRVMMTTIAARAVLRDRQALAQRLGSDHALVQAYGALTDHALPLERAFVRDGTRPSPTSLRRARRNIRSFTGMARAYVRTTRGR